MAGMRRQPEGTVGCLGQHFALHVRLERDTPSERNGAGACERNRACVEGARALPEEREASAHDGLLHTGVTLPCHDLALGAHVQCSRHALRIGCNGALLLPCHQEAASPHPCRERVVVRPRPAPEAQCEAGSCSTMQGACRDECSSSNREGTRGSEGEPTM